MMISADFPGGNILVDSVDGDTICLRQDRRDSTAWWFYWAFKVTGAAGRSVKFCFGDGNVFTSQGPCFSRDGQDWRWLGSECVSGATFTYVFAREENEGWFALVAPYTEHHLQRFLSAHLSLHCGELARTELERRVELLTLPALTPRGAVLFTARAHACEAQASYLLEGIMDAWINSTDDSAVLREQVDLYVVPFVDKDGVEQGDQGKLRAPHDHNRDFSESPRYASTVALMELVGRHAARWRAVFDLHCPWIRNADNEKVFWVEGPEPHTTTIRDFSRSLVACNRSPLPFYAEDNFAYGKDWNQGEGATFARYVREHTPCPLVGTLEFPYAVAHEAIVTPDAAREFGRGFIRALAQHFGPSSI